MINELYPNLDLSHVHTSDARHIILFCAFGYGYCNYFSTKICEYLERENVHDPRERFLLTYCILRDSGFFGSEIVAEIKNILRNDPTNPIIKTIEDTFEGYIYKFTLRDAPDGFVDRVMVKINEYLTMSSYINTYCDKYYEERKTISPSSKKYMVPVTIGLVAFGLYMFKGFL